MSGQIILVERASGPATPASGDISLYAKTDDVLYFKTSAGVETALATSAPLKAFAIAMAIALG